MNINQLVRKNIKNLTPYSSAREEFNNAPAILLDANENPYGSLNRYPDPYQRELKSLLSSLKSIAAEQIFIGNGSDEIIDLAFRTFCEPNQHKAITFSPTYGMYEVAAKINNVELIQLPLNANFQIDKNSLAPYLQSEEIRLIFICNPNNPTGNTFESATLTFLLENFKGIVVIDEAYIDFSNSQSFVAVLEKYPQLIVCQTLSKSWGLANARIGMAFSSKEIVHYFNKIKPPYNVSGLNQKAAINALKSTSQYIENIESIFKEKKRLSIEIAQFDFVVKIYSSETNFLLIQVSNSNRLFNYLKTNGIIVRNRGQQIANCIRISVGTKNENNALLKLLKTYT